MHESKVKELVARKDVQGLIAALTHKNMDVRRTAAEALGVIGDKRAVEPLIAALNDTTDYLVIKQPLRVPCTPVDARGEAALALGKIGGVSASEALRAVTETGMNRGVYRGLSVGEAVEKALVELGVAQREAERIPEASTGKKQKTGTGSRRGFFAKLFRGPDKSTEEMLKAAEDLRNQGSLRKALRWAKQATKSDPSNGRAWMKVGLIEVARGNVVSATKAFETAVSTDPDLKGSEPGARLAIVYESLGMSLELQKVHSSLDSAGLGLDPGMQKEWVQLVADVNPKKLRAAIASGQQASK